jgi:MFS family permease
MSDPASGDSGPARADPPASARALLHERDFLLFWGSRWLAILGAQIQSVALGWQIYDIARRSMDVKHAAFQVSLIGLVSFVPVLFLALPAGEAADRYDRRKVLMLCFTGEIITIAILAAAAWFNVASIPLLLAVAFAFGASRAFFSPANSAMGPMLVPRALLPRAIAWNSLAWQSASIAGPAVGGLLLAISPAVSYTVGLAFYLISFLLIALIRTNAKPVVQPGSRWTLVKEGLSYVWNNKIVFGSISLDLFAVLLGGATALLPIFARDILHVGPGGYGILRAAPAIGATLVAIYLAAKPIQKHAGHAMFIAVGLFGVATIVFGYSQLVWVSVLALATLGGADMVSVYVRQTLVQLSTPDHMRGRVSTVSSLFIGASNELGEFETGLMARFMGPVGAAIFGGVGALFVTGIWAWMFPALRKADHLN